MAKSVVISERTGIFKRWADQFVRADSRNRGIIYAGNISRNFSYAQKLRYINNYYARAIRMAGSGGRLIISLGHGGASETDSSVGMVDLLPHRELRVQRDQLRYFGSETVEGDSAALSRSPAARTCRRLFNRYDFDESTSRPTPPDTESATLMGCMGARSARSRGDFRQIFSRIGELMYEEELSDVVFLTCRVGGATEFIDQISQIWRIKVIAYKLRVAANSDESESPYYVYLVGEESRKYRDRIPTRQRYETSV